MKFFWKWVQQVFPQLSWSIMYIYYWVWIVGIITYLCSMIDHDSHRMCTIVQTGKGSEQEFMKDRNWPQLKWEV